MDQSQSGESALCGVKNCGITLALLSMVVAPFYFMYLKKKQGVHFLVPDKK